MRKVEDHTVCASFLSAALASSDVGVGLESWVVFGLTSCGFKVKGSEIRLTLERKNRGVPI